jgi:demethylmenaquinone methyltransferase/2-methoxy-6-polyprenyl-1,4-benzoquinol methylase
LDGEPPESFDTVMSGLCFSELSEGELDFALAQAMRILKPRGRLIVCDEVKPSGFFRRLVHSVVRAPVALLTYFITGQTTSALGALPDRVEKEGFLLESVRWSAMGSFIELVVRKPASRTA